VKTVYSRDAVQNALTTSMDVHGAAWSLGVSAFKLLRLCAEQRIQWSKGNAMNEAEAKDVVKLLEAQAEPCWQFVTQYVGGGLRVVACLPNASHSKEVLDIRNSEDAYQFLSAVAPPWSYP
jgi:hypothetical protein